MKLIYSFKVFMAFAVFALFTALPNTLTAGPGAHGPNGEHLDAPNATSMTGTKSPRFEVQSESYEVVGTLLKQELSMLIDRFDTNVPVRKARVQVELGALKAEAKYKGDIGNFAIEDASILSELWKPGDHAFVISIIEQENSDLIDVKLSVGDATDSHSHFEFKSAIALALALAVGLLIALLGFVALKKRPLFTKFRQGGL